MDAPRREQGFRVFRVREERAVNPRNSTEHAITLLDCSDWVNVLALTSAQELILVRQFRFGSWAPSLEVPGGAAEPGEAPERAAARELEEETGYRAEKLSLLGVVHPNPAFQTNRCHCFFAEGCVQVHGGAQDAGEDIAVELHPRSELRRLILDGEITHSLVLSAFLLDLLASRG